MHVYIHGCRRAGPSEHIELQIYNGSFFSDRDLDLCRKFHCAPWEERAKIANQFVDSRLRRLARRLIYFERPHLVEEAERQIIEQDIIARRRGEGQYVLASLAFCSSTALAPKIASKRWDSEVQANNVRLTGLRRVFKNSSNLAIDQIETAVGEAISSFETFRAPLS